ACFFIFLFSSRRRHTRFSRDWSSDVCSSDLDYDGRKAIDWGIYGAPETFLVDAEGIVRWKHVGPIDEATIERSLLPALDAIGVQIGRASCREGVGHAAGGGEWGVDSV